MNRYFYIGFAPVKSVDRLFHIPGRFKKKQSKDIFCIVILNFLLVIGGKK